MVGRTVVRLCGSALVLVACALMAAAPVLADEAPYLADMPTPEVVIEKTQGADALDTAARQYVAFSMLESMMVQLIGDRLVTTGQTPAEKARRDAYHDNYLRIQSEVLASLPVGEREFRPDSGYGKWRAMVDTYCCSPDQGIEDQLLEALFPADFLEMYAPIRAAAAARDPWFGFASPAPNTATSKIAGSGSTTSTQVVTAIGLVVLGFAFPILVKRSRLKLDAKDVFRLHLGGGSDTLHHVTGPVRSPTKLGTTSVAGSGGGGHDGDTAPIVITSHTTIHDQFFIDKGDGRLESIQLADWNFPVAEGHVVSAVWTFHKGLGHYVVMRNHTTNYADSNEQFLAWKLERYRAWATWLVQAGLCVAAAILLAPYLDPLVGFGAAVIGAFFGSFIWEVRIKRGLVRRFQRHDVPRIVTTLDGLVAKPL